MRTRHFPALALLASISALHGGCGQNDEPSLATTTAAVTNTWNVPPSPVDATPVPGDYDNDGKLDIAVKGSNGYWYIDLAANGFYTRTTAPPYDQWDLVYWGYGDSSGTPVPADYDGDGGTDIAIKGADGKWYIDYQADGFGNWDTIVTLPNLATGAPAVGKYDHDAKADIAIMGSDGYWRIDYAADGFGSWNLNRFVGVDGTWIPTPADYDGDGVTDISAKSNAGNYDIDISTNGLGKPCSPVPCRRPTWDYTLVGYGDNTGKPVPADYDGDHLDDIAIKGADAYGEWYIDYAAGGFGTWNNIYQGYGPGTSVPVPGDYDADGRLDLSAVDLLTGRWWVDYWGVNGFGQWNTWPVGTLYLDNPSRNLRDERYPYISSMTIYAPDGTTVPLSGAQYALTIGNRYTVALGVTNGQTSYSGCVGANPSLSIPTALNVNDAYGCNPQPILHTSQRWLAFECNQPGSFPLGFEIDGGALGATNRDFGVRVNCNAPAELGGQSGLYGRVMTRSCSGAAVCGTGIINDHTPDYAYNTVNSVYRNDGRSAGPAISGAAGATVNVTSKTGYSASPTVDSQGYWSLTSTPVGVPLRVEVSAPGRSNVIAINLVVPTWSGVELDTPLEEDFAPLRAAGINYTTYIDYSRGRTILHALAISPALAVVRDSVAPKTRVPIDPPGCSSYGSNYPTQAQFDPLLLTSSHTTALATMNSIWADQCTGDSVGYAYHLGNTPSHVWCDDATNLLGDTEGNNCANSHLYDAETSGQYMYPSATTAMFTIKGQSTNQTFTIVPTPSNFLGGQYAWNDVPTSGPIWDALPPVNASDVDYALQMNNPPLVVTDQAGTRLIRDGNQPDGDLYTWSMSSTAVGVGPNNELYWVVADGEGVHGGNGATPHQLATFFADELGAVNAIKLDSGWSTQMNLKSSRGFRHVNTITAEDGRVDINPYNYEIGEQFGGYGTIEFYLTAGSQ